MKNKNAIPRTKWPRESVEKLIRLRGKKYAHLFNGTNKECSTAWTHIQRELKRYRLQQIQKKWHSLMHSYKVLKLGLEVDERYVPSADWPFYHLMDEAMGHKFFQDSITNGHMNIHHRNSNLTINNYTGAQPRNNNQEHNFTMPEVQLDAQMNIGNIKTEAQDTTESETFDDSSTPLTQYTLRSNDDIDPTMLLTIGNNDDDDDDDDDDNNNEQDSNINDVCNSIPIIDRKLSNILENRFRDITQQQQQQQLQQQQQQQQQQSVHDNSFRTNDLQQTNPDNNLSYNRNSGGSGIDYQREDKRQAFNNSNRNIVDYHKDDVAIYADYVASSMRQLDPRSVLIAQNKINSILFEAGLGRFKDLH